MRKFAVIVLIAMLLVTTVLAIHDYAVYDSNIDGYAGQLAKDRRVFDPYSRDRYFGANYQPYLVNYGSKGPTYRVTNTGAKSAFSDVFNLDTNTFSNQGRNPGRISNFDPNVRGFVRLDAVVDLLPYSPVGELISGDPAIAKATARILSTGNEYGASLNDAWPRTQFFLQATNLPPIGENEAYEVWLVDDETEYSLSLGLIKSGVGLTSSLTFEIRRLVHMFEQVMITRESYPDPNPMPNEIVLIGNIGPARTVIREPNVYFDERLR